VLCENLVLQVIENKIEFNSLVPLIQSCERYSLKDLKIIFENSGIIRKYIQTSGSLRSSIDLLHIIVSKNLIDVYDNFSIFVKLIIDLKASQYKELIKADSNYYFKFLYVISNFSLRTLEINPIFNILLHEFKDIIQQEESLTTENLRYILESLACLELLMKHGITKVNYSEIFDSELITSLLKLYISRVETSMRREINEQAQQIIKVTDRHFSINIFYTNLLPFSILEYKGHKIPLIFVNSKLGTNLNNSRKLYSSSYILYRHLKSYLDIHPMILDISQINSLLEFDQLFQKYLVHPKRECMSYLD
jgi:hypothetical protein